MSPSALAEQLPLPLPQTETLPRQIQDLPWELTPPLYLAALCLMKARKTMREGELLLHLRALAQEHEWPLLPLSVKGLHDMLHRHARQHGRDGLLLSVGSDHWQLHPQGGAWLTLVQRHLDNAERDDAATKGRSVARLCLIVHGLVTSAPAGGMPTKVLADWLGQGARQTQRDLGVLGRAGFPVAQSDDLLPTYAIHERGWNLLDALLTQDEQAALYLMLRHSFKGWGHLAATRRVLLHLAATLPAELRGALVEDIEEVGNEGPAHLLENTLTLVVTAWSSRRALLVDGVSHRIMAVEPLRTTIYVIHRPTGGSVTATRLDDWMYAHLQLGKVVGPLTSTSGSLHQWAGEQVQDSPALDLDSPYEDVTLVISGDARRDFQPTVPTLHPSQQVQSGNDGRLLVTMTVPGTEGLMPHLLRWGGDVEVIGPVSLRARLCAHYTDLAARLAAPAPALPMAPADAPQPLNSPEPLRLA